MSPSLADAKLDAMNGSTAPGEGPRQRTVVETFRDFWATRPVRPRRGGRPGGVASALGHRYGIDPVLFRVAFVVGVFFSGVGPFLYLLGWLVLPKEAEPRQGPDGLVATSRNTPWPVAVVLVLLLFPATFEIMDWQGMLGLVVAAGTLYFLHRHYGDRKPPSVGTPPPQGPVAPTSPNTWVYPGTTESSAEPSGRSSESLGVSTATPSAESSIPEPGTSRLLGAEAGTQTSTAGKGLVESDRQARRLWVTLGTLGLALLAGAASFILRPHSPADAAGTTLAVLGAGMVVGAFLHAGRALIIPAFPLALLALVLNMLPGPWYGIKDVDAHPTTLGQLAPEYRASAGRISLDLRHLHLAGGQQAITRADLGAGVINVRVPNDMDVTATCSARNGEVACLDAKRSGREVRSSVTNFSTQGSGNGHLVLDLGVGTGEVEVHRD